MEESRKLLNRWKQNYKVQGQQVMNFMRIDIKHKMRKCIQHFYLLFPCDDEEDDDILELDKCEM